MIALLTLGFFIAGCAEGDKSGSVTNPNPDVFAPLGSISGVVFDFCANTPVKGAVVSVAYSGVVHKVTTDATGAFSFVSVPAIGYSNYTPYYVTAQCPTTTYGGYSKVEGAWVTYDDLGDGTNGSAISSEYTLDAFIESGSGASTPVTNLAATVEFLVAAPTASITGNVYDLTEGLEGAAADVYLFDKLSNQIAKTTSAASTGAFTFSNVPPIASSDSYYIQVVKAGYEYVDDNEGTYVRHACHSCGKLLLSCDVACATTVTGVAINIWSNPAKDKTVPYITNVNMGDETNIASGDLFEELVPGDVTNFVVTFNEKMAPYRPSMTYNNPVDLTSNFYVLVTSGGTLPTGRIQAQRLLRTDIIGSFTVAMGTSGVMTIAPTLKTTAQLAAEVSSINSKNIAPANLTDVAWGPTATVQILGGGTFRVEFEENSPRLTDAALVPWSIGCPGNEHHGFLYSPASYIQNERILGQCHGHTRNWIKVQIGAAEALPSFAAADTIGPWVTSLIIPGGPAAGPNAFGGGAIFGEWVDATSADVTPFADIQLNFNEPMEADHFAQDSLSLTTSFTVLVTSAVEGSSYVDVQHDSVEILDKTSDSSDFSYDWINGATTLKINLNVLSADDIAAKWYTWDAGAASVTFVSGTYDLALFSAYGSTLFDQAWPSMNVWDVNNGPLVDFGVMGDLPWQLKIFDTIGGPIWPVFECYQGSFPVEP